MFILVRLAFFLPEITCLALVFVFPKGARVIASTPSNCTGKQAFCPPTFCLEIGQRVHVTSLRTEQQDTLCPPTSAPACLCQSEALVVQGRKGLERLVFISTQGTCPSKIVRRPVLPLTPHPMDHSSHFAPLLAHPLNSLPTLHTHTTLYIGRLHAPVGPL